MAQKWAVQQKGCTWAALRNGIHFSWNDLKSLILFFGVTRLYLDIFPTQEENREKSDPSLLLAGHSTNQGWPSHTMKNNPQQGRPWSCALDILSASVGAIWGRCLSNVHLSGNFVTFVLKWQSLHKKKKKKLPLLPFSCFLFHRSFNHLTQRNQLIYLICYCLFVFTH